MSDAKAAKGPRRSAKSASRGVRFAPATQQRIDDLLAGVAGSFEQVTPQLQALLAAQEMTDVWRFLNQAEISQNGVGLVPELLFLETAYSALSGPLCADAALSPRQHARWRLRVEQLACELAGEIRDTRLDQVLGIRAAGNDGAAPLSSILEALAATATGLSPAMKRPQGAEAPKVYFVRRLAEFFEQHFSDRHVEYVTAARNAAFDDDATVAQVKRQLRKQ